MLSTSSLRGSKLDLAILVSLAAMAAMNVFVLAQQLPSATAMAVVGAVGAPSA